MRVIQGEKLVMPTDSMPGPEECTCLAVRQAARRITQFYDQHLAPMGLRTTQFSILAGLKRLGPTTINALAYELVMDRTTLGRNILPLERDGRPRVPRLERRVAERCGRYRMPRWRSPQRVGSANHDHDHEP